MKFIYSILLALLVAPSVYGQQKVSAEIDKDVKEMQRAYHVPGLSVVVIQG